MRHRKGMSNQVKHETEEEEEGEEEEGEEEPPIVVGNIPVSLNNWEDKMAQSTMWNWIFLGESKVMKHEQNKTGGDIQRAVLS